MADIIIIAVACVVGLISLIMAWTSKLWSAPVGFAGLCVMYLIPESGVVTGMLIFWGIAAIIAAGINSLLPPEISRSRVSLPYVVIGAVAGALIGIIMSQAAMIIGACAGALCGAVAYSRTPAGGVLGFPSRKFFNFVCAKGLPVVVTICECGMIALSIMTYYIIVNQKF